MNPFAMLVLLLCIPLVLLTFSLLPPRRAVITSAVASWLFLPNAGVALPGLPDFTKTSAMTIGMLLSIAVFDSGRLLRFRPKWFDLPIFVWCAGNILTSITNDLGLYDGLSSAFRASLTWGFPYLIGRIYLDEPEGVRDLAMGFVIGGLVYTPFCLYEIRFFPSLGPSLYGTTPNYEPPRFHLGYRPVVFMVTGLEVGMWMAASALCAYWLWVTGTVRQLRGVPFAQVVALLAVMVVLCKSIGAILLLGLGLGLLELVRRRNAAWFVLVLALLPPTYITLRTTGLWSGRSLVDWIENVAFISERQDSLMVRLVSEDHLMERAFQRPWLGWGGYNRSRIIVDGRDMYPTDGYWIITFGTQGLVGLVSMTAAFVLPLWLTYRRFPARLWVGPVIGPAAALAVLLGLYMLDNLSNAMANPVYALAIGAVSGLRAVDPRTARRVAAEQLARGSALIGAGQTAGAEAAYREALELYASPEVGPAGDPEVSEEVAHAHEALAGLALASGPGRSDEAREHLLAAAGFREAALAAIPDDPVGRERLAAVLEDLGRLLFAQGFPGEAERTWARALELRSGLSAEAPGSAEHLRRLADGHNDLAWLLTGHRDARPDAVHDAVRLARVAVELMPAEGAYWNTLGAASYYAGDYPAAVDALTRSAELCGGGTGFDHFLLAMAYARLGAPELARECFALADAWSRANHPDHAGLARLHDEAAAVLGG